MLLSGYIGYFCRDERMSKGYDILSYIFMIHGLVLRGGCCGYSVWSVPGSCIDIIEGVLQWCVYQVG